MKTKKEPPVLRNEVKTPGSKLAELTGDEPDQVAGGSDIERQTQFNKERSEDIEWEHLIEG